MVTDMTLYEKLESSVLVTSINTTIYPHSPREIH